MIPKLTDFSAIIDYTSQYNDKPLLLLSVNVYLTSCIACSTAATMCPRPLQVVI